MNNFFLKAFMSLNTCAIRVSRGRLGSRLGTQTILLLHTRGRRSGKSYITPIAYFQLDGFYFLVGSNWGRDKNAAWYYNLLSQAHAIVEVKGHCLSVLAHPAHGLEYERLWSHAVEHHPPYLHYRDMTSRPIPIMVLQPQDQ